MKQPDQPRWMFGGEVSEDGMWQMTINLWIIGKYLIVTVSESTAPVNRLYYSPIDGSGSMMWKYCISLIDLEYQFTKLIDNFDAAYGYITNDDNIFYFRTNLNAPKYRVIAIDINNPATENWREIIPESEDVMGAVEPCNKNQFAVNYLHDVKVCCSMFVFLFYHLLTIIKGCIIFV